MGEGRRTPGFAPGRATGRLDAAAMWPAVASGGEPVRVAVPMPGPGAHLSALPSFSSAHPRPGLLA